MPVPKPPILSEEFRPVSAGQRQMLGLNGHVMMRGLMTTAEAAGWRPAVQDMVRRHRADKVRMEDSGIYGRGYARVTNTWREDEHFRRFILAKRFGRVAADLLGVSNVRIYHDQVLFKEPGAMADLWHRDQDGRPLDTDNTISLWMPLTDLGVDMGLQMFADGSNRILSSMLNNDNGPAGHDLFYRRLIKQQQLVISRPAGMRAGDASWHTGTVLHSSAPNLTDKIREVVSIIYMADGARVTKPVNEQQEFEWKTWLNQLPPGRLAASELNPLVL